MTALSPSLMVSTVTVTTDCQTTYHATLGATLTIYPQLSSWTLGAPTSTTSYTPIPTLYPTVTVTELGIIVEGVNGEFRSTWVIPVTSPNPTAGATDLPSPYVLIVGPHRAEHGWNSWSSSQQAGLIAGVTLAGVFILGLLLCWLYPRRKLWIANDWSVNNHPMYGINQPGQMIPYGQYGWGIRS